ncbi:helix-turn-helix domain-containing protein [Streptomyces sp. NBC_01304]|uniref:helix-turn-helix domain-containing protein n=1 Tax=Streptomyces sp. NBC_01304 TaxID=2903818 RepID=UPI002E166EEE|nr:XRE family transcriptional regulator [Streptomyces sp. NBC_01304]
MTGAGGAREREQLAAVLRELRDDTGLSLNALAAKTAYSKSSWARYLGGRSLPPRHAVEALCLLAGREPGGVLALYELVRGASRGGAGVRRASAPAGPVSVGRRSRRIWAVAGSVVAAAVGVYVWSLLGTGATGGTGTGGTGAGGRGAVAGAREGHAPGCLADSCTGRDAEALRCSTATHQPVVLAERRYADGVVVKLRHSERCGTVWARIDRGAVGDRVELHAPEAKAQRREVQDDFDARGSVSTPMAFVRSADLSEVRACLVHERQRSCFGSAD